MTLRPDRVSCALRSDDGFVADFEIPGLTAEMYDDINRAVFAPLPGGLRLHAAYPLKGSWRIVEIWESQADWEAYRDTILGPALAKRDAPEPRVHLGALARAYLCNAPE